MRAVGRSFSVHYDHSGAVARGTSEHFAKRTEYPWDYTYNVSYSPDIAFDLPLFPPNTTIDDTVPTTLVQYVTPYRRLDVLDSCWRSIDSSRTPKLT